MHTDNQHVLPACVGTCNTAGIDAHDAATPLAIDHQQQRQADPDVCNI